MPRNDTPFAALPCSLAVAVAMISPAWAKTPIPLQASEDVVVHPEFGGVGSGFVSPGNRTGFVFQDNTERVFSPSPGEVENFGETIT